MNEMLQEYYKVFSDCLALCGRLVAGAGKSGGGFWNAALDAARSFAADHGDSQLSHDLANASILMAGQAVSGCEVPYRDFIADLWSFFRDVCRNGDFLMEADALRLSSKYGNAPWVDYAVRAARDELVRIRSGRILESGDSVQRELGNTDCGLSLKAVSDAAA